MVTADTTSQTVGTLPDGPRTPRFVQAVSLVAAPLWGLRRAERRYGSAFRVNVPVFGRAVVVSDPDEVRALFMAPQADVDHMNLNLSRVLGPNSLFGLSGEAHRRQRKLLTPPFHGQRLRGHEVIIEEETTREIASWPEGAAFPVLPSMLRITLNAILRAVFGAAGAELDELRELLPRAVKLGSQLALLPVPRVGFLDRRGWGPWGRADGYRRQYDEIIDRLITRARQDPALESRGDVLALMLQARYDDGTVMSRDEIADQMLTLLTAGHETTATTLAWAVERLRRHPGVLDRLVAEVDAGGAELREAVIQEVQRTRPVIDAAARQVRAESLRLGRWTLPRGQVVIASIYLMHRNPSLFPDPGAFTPDRFLDARPDTYQWIPFCGGVRRCIGAAFAHMEMNVVLRTLLREVTLVPTDAPDERWSAPGVAYSPAKGGLVVVQRRHANARTSGVTGERGE